MTNQCSSAYITYLSLLMSVVLFEHSLFYLCESHLPYILILFVAPVAAACWYFIVVSTFLKMNESFQTHYWNIFNLTAAQFVLSGDTTDWTPYSGQVTFLIGFLIFSLHGLYSWICNAPRQDARDDIVPLPVEVSFVLMGNEMVMLGKWFLPLSNNSFEWKLLGGAIMLSLSSMFFFFYYTRTKSRPPVHVD